MMLTLLHPWKATAWMRLTETEQVPAQESETIESDGVVLGTVVRHQLGVRFIAANDRLTDMDQSVWPTQEYARRAARQMFGSKYSANSR